MFDYSRTSGKKEIRKDHEIHKQNEFMADESYEDLETSKYFSGQMPLRSEESIPFSKAEVPAELRPKYRGDVGRFIEQEPAVNKPLEDMTPEELADLGLEQGNFSPMND